MKKIPAVIFLCFLYLASHAQSLTDKEIPAKVKQAFKQHYPAAKDPDWYKEDKNYLVKFLQVKIETSVLYDKAGVVIRTEIGIAIEKLPTAARDYLKKNYAGNIVDSATKVTTAKGETTYEVFVAEKTLLFDSKGKFLKEQENQ